MTQLQHQMGPLAFTLVQISVSIHHSTSIQSCFLKYNRVLKSHPNIKGHIKYVLLSHSVECNMRNIFRVSQILQLISRAFRQVKQLQNMRNEENICQYCTKQRAITTLSKSNMARVILLTY